MKTKIGFQDRLPLNAGQKFCRMLQGEHSAILSTLIKLPIAFKTFVLPIFEWPLKTGFTVYQLLTPFAYKHSFCLFLLEFGGSYKSFVFRSNSIRMVCNILTEFKIPTLGYM